MALTKRTEVTRFGTATDAVVVSKDENGALYRSHVGTPQVADFAAAKAYVDANQVKP